VPVDVATYLINEKREWLRTLEDKSDVELIVVPNLNIDTPEFSIRRIRDDEIEAPENKRLSFQMPTPAQVADPAGTREKKAEPEPAVVPTFLPPTPAPIIVHVPAPAAAVDAAPAPVQVLAPVPEIGALRRFKRWLFGDPVVPMAATSTPAAAQADGGGRGDGRPGQGSGSGSRDRNDRGRDGRRRGGSDRDRPRGEARGRDRDRGERPRDGDRQRDRDRPRDPARDNSATPEAAVAAGGSPAVAVPRDSGGGGGGGARGGERDGGREGRDGGREGGRGRGRDRDRDGRGHRDRPPAAATGAAMTGAAALAPGAELPREEGSGPVAPFDAAADAPQQAMAPTGDEAGQGPTDGEASGATAGPGGERSGERRGRRRGRRGRRGGGPREAGAGQAAFAPNEAQPSGEDYSTDGAESGETGEGPAAESNGHGGHDADFPIGEPPRSEPRGGASISWTGMALPEPAEAIVVDAAPFEAPTREPAAAEPELEASIDTAKLPKLEAPMDDTAPETASLPVQAEVESPVAVETAAAHEPAAAVVAPTAPVEAIVTPEPATAEPPVAWNGETPAPTPSRLVWTSGPAPQPPPDRSRED
jgi:ribonuclease E